MALLEVKDLAVEFPAPERMLRAVDQVSFSVEQGEIMGLVGESGSGKTVACRALMRLLPGRRALVSGEARFEGRDLLRLDERALADLHGRRLAMIFQNPSSHLDPLMTIGRQVAEPLIWHERLGPRAARARAVELLRQVGIPDPGRTLEAYAHQLSGGMRQRVMIAIALACRPSLVIADEPTTALDVTIQAEILDLLREMKAAFHLSLLLITHDLGVVAETADRVAVMYAGRIVETGPVRAIFRTPAHPYTRGLLASMPHGRRGERLRAIDGTVPMLGDLPSGCAFNPRCPDRFEPCTSAPPPDYAAGPEQTAKCYLHGPR